MQETGLLRNSRGTFFFLLMMTYCSMLIGFLPMSWPRQNFQRLSFLAVGFFPAGKISRPNGLGENVLRCWMASWFGMITVPRYARTYARRTHHSARALRFGELCSR